MSESVIRLSVPAQPSFARSVRMMAANLAVLCSMNVDEVEDARMAAEEAFVLACATRPEGCAVGFTLGEGTLTMSFALGESDIDEADEQVSMSRLLLSYVCESFEFADDGSALVVDLVAEGVHAD